MEEFTYYNLGFEFGHKTGYAECQRDVVEELRRKAQMWKAVGEESVAQALSSLAFGIEGAHAGAAKGGEDEDAVRAMVEAAVPPPRRHNERTPAEEAVLRAGAKLSVMIRLPSDDSSSAPDAAVVSAARRVFHAAVDALLRENPAWGEEGQR